MKTRRRIRQRNPKTPNHISRKIQERKINREGDGKGEEETYEVTLDRTNGKTIKAEHNDGAEQLAMDKDGLIGSCAIANPMEDADVNLLCKSPHEALFVWYSTGITHYKC